MLYTVYICSIEGIQKWPAPSYGPTFAGGGLVQLADLSLDSRTLHPTMASFNWIAFREILLENPRNTVPFSAVGLVQLADVFLDSD